MNGWKSLAMGWIATSVVACTAVAESPQAAASARTAGPEAVLAQTAKDGKFAFIVFCADDSPETRKMLATVTSGVTKRPSSAALVVVRTTDPAQRPIVDQFQVARAPKPLTLVVAPNGAITGAYSKTVQDIDLASSIVTPAMMASVKSLQEGKLVMICVQTSDQAVIPPGVAAMRADPAFKDRLIILSIRRDDAKEARFLSELEVNPAKVTATTSVLLAPPGVVVGTFASTATLAEIGASLHDAGKCCDDANCKHHHDHKQANTPAKTKRN